MRPIAGLLVLLGIGLTGCGGNRSGFGDRLVAVEGRVLWIVTGVGPSPPASVRVGNVSTTTDPVDGSFAVVAPVGATSLTVTYLPPGQGPIVRSFGFPALTAPTDLGDLYIGPETVSVRGRVASAGDDAPILGATVAIGGQRSVSGIDGRFSVDGVAYSPDSETVFLGLQGTASAPEFIPRNFNPPAGPISGVVEVGTVALSPLGSNDPPAPPFNVRGRVLPAGRGQGASVAVLRSGVVIRTSIANGFAEFELWLPVGDYTLRVSQGAAVAEAPLRIDSTNVIKNVDVTLP